MWLPDLKVVLNKIKLYSNPAEALPPLITEKNVLLSTPKTIPYALQARQAWNERMSDALSSPSRRQFESYTRGVEEQLQIGELVQNDLIQIRIAVKESQKAKATYRMYTVSKGPITVKDAQKSVADKVAQKKPKKPIQVDTQFIIPLDDDDEIGGVDNEDISPEL